MDHFSREISFNLGNRLLQESCEVSSIERNINHGLNTKKLTNSSKLKESLKLSWSPGACTKFQLDSNFRDLFPIKSHFHCQFNVQVSYQLQLHSHPYNEPFCHFTTVSSSPAAPSFCSAPRIYYSNWFKWQPLHQSQSTLNDTRSNLALTNVHIRAPITPLPKGPASQPSTGKWSMRANASQCSTWLTIQRRIS